MIEVINLDFDYPERPLLHNVGFSVSPGTLLHLRGSNGAGKTTLLKLIAGLIFPTQGVISFKGKSIHEDRAQYQQNLCYIGHKTGISSLLTVKENCEFALCRNKEVDLEALLQRFSLQDFSDIHCSSLSAGQRRRVGLLRLLLSQAPLWLLDEPLNALDKEGIIALMECIEEHVAHQGCVILTSHQDLPLEQVNYQEYCL